MSDRLLPGQVLKEGESVHSEDSEYTFIVQDDGKNERIIHMYMEN